MTIELAILSMCIISLIWNAINTYLIVRKNKTYEIPVEDIDDTLQPTAFEPIKDEEISKKTKRKPFLFSMIGLKAGDKIYSTIDKNEFALVFDDKQINFRNNLTSLSKATAIIMHDNNRQLNCWTFQGPIYWTYKGKLLDDIRKEMENKE